METPSMLPIILRELESAGAAEAAGDRVTFAIDPHWCAPGEDRLGYCGVVRLMECVRELHWRRDVAPAHPDVDSITKSLVLDFAKPLIAGSKVTGTYAVIDVSARSYTLQIVLCDSVSADELAQGQLVSVFYDGVRHRVVEPPSPLVTALRAAR